VAHRYVFGIAAERGCSVTEAAGFILALVAIDAKPSCKRIWNPPDRGLRAYEGLRFFSWKRR
jgi:hypothetical protein